MTDTHTEQTYTFLSERHYQWWWWWWWRRCCCWFCIKCNWSFLCWNYMHAIVKLMEVKLLFSCFSYLKILRWSKCDSDGFFQKKLWLFQVQFMDIESCSNLKSSTHCIRDVIACRWCSIEDPTSTFFACMSDELCTQRRGYMVICSQTLFIYYPMLLYI